MFFDKPLCDVCKKNSASVYVSRISFGKMSKQRLCEECARKNEAGKEWLQNLEQQPNHEGLGLDADSDEIVQSLYNHLDKANGDFDSSEIDTEAIEQAFAESLNLPAEELDEFLAEMESMLDEVIGSETGKKIEPEFSVESLLPGNGDLPQSKLNVGPASSGAREVLSARCPKCGTTWDRLREDGRAGCARCYEAFEEQLLEVMERMQREVHHVGKEPRAAQKRRRRLEHLRTKRDHRLEMLQRRLKEAIAAENYEDAAALRDKIKMVSSTIVQDD